MNGFFKFILGFFCLGFSFPICAAAEIDSAPVGPRHARQMSEGLSLFKNKVRDILLNNCVECHGRDEIEGGLDLSTRASLLASGYVAEYAEESDLMDSISHRFEPYMPHERDKLDEESVEAIARLDRFGSPL